MLSCSTTGEHLEGELDGGEKGENDRRKGLRRGEVAIEREEREEGGCELGMKLRVGREERESAKELDEMAESVGVLAEPGANGVV